MVYWNGGQCYFKVTDASIKCGFPSSIKNVLMTETKALWLVIKDFIRKQVTEKALNKKDRNINYFSDLSELLAILIRLH